MILRFRFLTPFALAVMLIALGIVSSGGAVSAGAGNDAADIIPGQYIVVFNDDVNDSQAAANDIAQQLGLSLKHTYSSALKGFAAAIPPPQAGRPAGRFAGAGGGAGADPPHRHP